MLLLQSRVYTEMMKSNASLRALWMKHGLKPTSSGRSTAKKSSVSPWPPCEIGFQSPAAQSGACPQFAVPIRGPVARFMIPLTSYSASESLGAEMGLVLPMSDFNYCDVFRVTMGDSLSP